MSALAAAAAPPRRGQLLVVIDDIQRDDALTTTVENFREDPVRFLVLSNWEIPRLGRPIVRLQGLTRAEVADVLASIRQVVSSDEFEQLVDVLAGPMHGHPILVQTAGHLLSDPARRYKSIAQYLADLHEVADTHVTHLVLVETAQRLRVVPTQLLPPTEIVTPGGVILPAQPQVHVPRFSTLWQEQLAEFESLLSVNASESAFQSFFERNPFFLKGTTYDDIRPHLVLERDDASDLIPDFFLRPIARDHADILDLKLPNDPVVVGRSSRRRFSYAVQDALAQVREYRNYFDDPRRRASIAQKYGLTAYRPKTVIVIGRTPANVSERELIALTDELPRHVEITTYDDLFHRMRHLVQMWGI